MQVEADDGSSRKFFVTMRVGITAERDEYVLPPAPERGQEECPGTAGGIEQAGFGLPEITDLIEHVLRQPAGRVVFAQGMPHGTRKKGLVERLEQITAASRVGSDRHRVVTGDACDRYAQGPFPCG